MRKLSLKNLLPPVLPSLSLVLLLIGAALLAPLSVQAQAPIIALPPGFVEDVVVGDLKFPTSFAFARDGRIFFAEKSGRVRVYQDGALLPEPFIDISGEVNDAGTRGLMSIALHPNFPSTPYVYLAYVYESAEAKSFPAGGARTSRLLRLSANPDNTNVVQPGSGVILLGKNSTLEHIGNPNETDAPPFTCFKPEGGHVQDCLPLESGAHSIGFMRFGRDGALYVSNGDGTVNSGANWRAQDIDSLGGKILRINPITGEGYASNPFFDGDPNSNRSKVYAYGLRNPFRFTLHPSTGELWIGEVGNDLWEEINRGGAGSNFGWPCYEGPDQASGEPICQQLFANGSPVTFATHAYLHEEGLGAAIGGDFYTGGSYPAAYQNAYFYADFNAGLILYLPHGNRSVPELFAASVRGPVQITRGPDGNLYVLSITNGLLSRIRVGSREGAPILNAPPPKAGTGSGADETDTPLPAVPAAPAAPIVPAEPANRAPKAALFAEPKAGRAPLDVRFSAKASSDPDGDVLTYNWDFGDGNSTDEVTANHTYSETGIYTTTLTVTDAEGAAQSKSVEIAVGNDPPVAKILRPYPTATLRIGDKVQYVGIGTDTEDGRVALDDMQWKVFLHHDDHVHFDLYRGQGRLGSFEYPDHGDGSYVELCLTVTDSAGLQDKDCVDLHPKEVTYTFHTIPSGVPITYAGTSYKTPFRVTTYVNAERQIAAPQLPVEGVRFLSWSNGGEREQALTIRATNQTLIAIFDGDSDELVGNSEIVNVSQQEAEEAKAPPPQPATAPAPAARAVAPRPSAPVANPPAALGSGQILREWWLELPGEAVENLLQHPDYPNAPSGSDLINAFEAPRTFDDNYGTRIRGYLYPPTSGEYRFWIAADDSAQLILSSDDNPANGVIIAAVPSWTHSQEWDRYPQQRSIGIQLEAGKRYYIEARHKESTGKDNLAVSWRIPGAGRAIIDGRYLSPINNK